MVGPLNVTKAWRRRRWTAWLLALGLGCSKAPAPAPQMPAGPPASLPPAALPAPASTPVPSPSLPPRRADLAEEAPAAGQLGERWQERHEALLKTRGRSSAQLVLLGDGVADAWYTSRAFQKQWRERKPLNLALPGDQTQQLLWRIEHGALDGLTPRLVLLVVGSENLARGFTPAETARGVAAVLHQVRTRLPNGRVLLLGLLPMGQSSEDPRRALGEATNAELRAVASAQQVTLAEPGGVFLEADGSITPGMMADDGVPTALGYEALTITVSLIAQRLLDAPR